MTQAKQLAPIHPGEILLEDFIRPLGISINRLARDLDVPHHRISAIVNGARAITADTALRLATYFRVSPETWLDLQVDCDLRLAPQRHGDQITQRVRTRPAARSNRASPVPSPKRKSPATSPAPRPIGQV